MLGHLLEKKHEGFQRLSQEEHGENLEEPAFHQALPLLVVVSVFSIVSFLLGGFLGSRFPFDMSQQCLRRVSQYSPAVSDSGLSYRKVDFNGSLLHENIYRQNASIEVDVAWAALGVDYRASIIPPDQAKKSGLTTHHVQLSEKYGSGFPANVEGLHHLHCLNLLRQSLYYNYEYYHSRKQGAFVNNDRILRFHVSHCLDILRQQLMCTIDVGVLGQVWWDKASPHAIPDFNTQHTCRDFETVRRWAEIHQAPADYPDDYLKRPVDGEGVYETIP